MEGTMTEASPSGRHDDPARVLLVDDDPDIRHVVRLYLQRVDAIEVVGEAADGQAAVDQARDLQPDIVLLDVMMPVMSGHEAIPDVLDVSPRSMIVMLSALHAGTQEDAALSAGAFAYVEKATLDVEFGERLMDLYARFSRALQGQTAWAPEHYPR